MQLIVIVKRLNKRSEVPFNLPDPANIIGVVKEGFTFEGVEADASEVPNSSLDKWFKDREGYFYWGAGLREVSLAEEAPVPSFSMEPEVLEAVGFEVAIKKDWGFIDFKIDELWKQSKGKNIKVAVLDTGLNFNLDDFKNNPNISFYNASMDSESKNDCQDSDPGGHGTDCAGILCGQGIRLFGVAPEVSLIIIKITNEDGERTTGAILKGLEKAIALQADILSLSFYIAKDENFEKIKNRIQEAHQKNITVLAAVGDSGSKIKPTNNYPASFPECLSIGGIDRNRTRGKASAKSNFLSLMGPGENVISLANPGKLVSGTSFSTPFVAGVVALLKSIQKNKDQPLSNVQLFDILQRSADSNIQGYDKIEYGFGIVDPVAALTLIQTG